MFYLPLLIAGPISSYRLFFSSFDANKKLELSYSNFLRLLLGLLKILVLSVFVLQLTTTLLISDYYTYSLSELIVSLYFNLIYAYLFLSGVCDVVISVSAIIGIDVEENFYCPIKSTNLVEFWKSWHVTLANAVKVTIFTPLFLYFRRKLRLKSQYYLTVPLTFLTFFLIGYFHFVDSRGWYLGLYHGFGVTICYVFNSTFKNQEFYLKLKRSIPYKLVCFGITWTFIAFSTLFFHYKNIDEIYNVIKTSF